MDDYLGRGQAGGPTSTRRRRRRSLPAPTSRPRKPQQGFEPLGVATGVSGVGAARLAKLTNAQRSYFPKSAYAAGRVSPGVATADDVVAGGNLAASYSYGDITSGGVGTATSVCNNKVVGFGHPMDFLGETTLSLHPASALYVQPDSLGCAVQGSQLRVARRHDLPRPPDRHHRQVRRGARWGHDHLRRQLRRAQPGRQLDRDRVGCVAVGRRSSSSWPTTTAWSTRSARVRRASRGRSRARRAGPRSRSRTATGSPPPIDISYDASYELADLVYLLSSVEGVDLDSVVVDGDVTNGAATYAVRATSSWSRGSGRRSTTATRPRCARAASSSSGRCSAAATAPRPRSRTRSRSRSGPQATRARSS